MTVLITLNTGDITFNDITCKWLYLSLILPKNDFICNSK
jgi:hypothetical protein